MGNILIRVAKNVRSYRLRLGMTQKKLGQKAHLSRGYISKIENAKVDIYLDVLIQVAKALKVQTKDLLK